MKALKLQESCTQYQVRRNRYGDLQLTALGTIPCSFRNINQLNRNVNFREEQNPLQAIFWFDPTSTIKMGDVVGYNGVLYRIEDVIVAKQLVTSNNIHFIKCNASIYQAIS